MVAPRLGAGALAAILFAHVLEACHALRLGAQPASVKNDGKKGKGKKGWKVTTKPFTGPLYFMHLPKAAGDSFLSDAPKYSGGSLKGSETNFCKARTGSNGTLERNVVAMMRDPRAHVLSMYFHCKTGHEYVMQGWHTRMPDRIIEWLRPWDKASAADSSEILHRFCCYSPVNLQSRRFSCSQDLEAAKRNLEKAFFIGLVEHYHLSMCIFGTKVRGTVPEDCTCEGKGRAEDWEADSHLNHGVQIHSASHLPASHLELIDNMTREDVELYERSRKRLWTEIERIEKVYKVRLACGEQRRTLRMPRAVLQRELQMAYSNRVQARAAAPQASVPSEPVPARAPARAAAPSSEMSQMVHARPPRPRAPPPSEPVPVLPPVLTLTPGSDMSLAAIAPQSEAVVAIPPPHVRARVPARPGRSPASLQGQAPEGPPVVDLHLRHVPARAHLTGRQGLSLVDLEHRAGCPNEGYLLHGTGVGR